MANQLLVTVPLKELERLQAIELMVLECVRESYEFHSWDTEERASKLWQDLAGEMEEGGHILFCQRCGAHFGTDRGHVRKYNGKSAQVCDTCNGELGPWHE